MPVLSASIADFIKAVGERILRLTKKPKEDYVGSSEPANFPRFAAIGVVAFVVLGIIAVSIIPRWQTGYIKTDPVRRFELEDTARKTDTQIVLGVFGLILVYFTWRRARAGDATVRILEQGHITDRFTKAIEQLGSLDSSGKPNIEVRLGAIYALERIAFDSARDHWTIMEVLTAYVRQNAPLLPSITDAYDDQSDARAVRSDGQSEDMISRDAIGPGSGPTPRTDIQAILTVLSRRSYRRERSDQHIDLSRCHLEGAELVKVNLQGANLRDTNVQGADLSDANLQEARLKNASLQRAILLRTKLNFADLSDAKLQRSTLIFADLYGAFISNANLKRAQLAGANLQGAILSGADLESAILQGTNMQGARLADADLQDAWLEKANLRDAVFDVEQVRSARLWQEAIYSEDVRIELGLLNKESPIDQL